MTLSLDSAEKKITKGLWISDNRLVAPIWHTGVLLALILIPRSLYPGAGSISAELHQLGRIGSYCADLCFLWLLLFVAIAGIFLNRTRLSEIAGRYSTQSLRDVVTDLLWGAGIYIVVLLVALGFVPLEPSGALRPAFLPRTSWELIAYVPLALSAGICEEVVFRGYFLSQLRRIGGSDVLGIVVQAAIFSVAHGYHQTIAEIAYKFTFGLVMGWVVVKRKALLPAVAAHSITDITAGIVSVLL